MALIFLTGPVRSGKSRRAVELAREWGGDVVFVATYRHDEEADAEMAVRVARHRAERPEWRTLEAPGDVIGALAALDPPPSGLVLDCLTLWLGDRFGLSDDRIIAEWREVAGFLAAAPWPSVVVGNEIGWAPVPEHPDLRRFRDLAGTLGQLTAAAADEAWLMVAGCPVRLR